MQGQEERGRVHREEERRPVRGLEGREEVQDDLRQVLSGSGRVIAHVRSCSGL